MQTDSAGVWWDSMPWEKRINYIAFLENQKMIESDWSATYGDRKNEIVFIGQDMDEAGIRTTLDACLSTEEELKTERWKKGYADEWPVQKVYALEE